MTRSLSWRRQGRRLGRAATLAVALALTLPGAATATPHAAETRKAAQRYVATTLGDSLSPTKRRAPHRVYDCQPGSCRFWARGTVSCHGVAQVREGTNFYRVWFSELRCS